MARQGSSSRQAEKAGGKQSDSLSSQSVTDEQKDVVMDQLETLTESPQHLTVNKSQTQRRDSSQRNTLQSL
jgi:hypothetical protein